MTLSLYVQYQDAVAHLAERELHLLQPANERHLQVCVRKHIEARAEVDRLARALTEESER